MTDVLAVCDHVQVLNSVGGKGTGEKQEREPWHLISLCGLTWWLFLQHVATTVTLWEMGCLRGVKVRAPHRSGKNSSVVETTLPVLCLHDSLQHRWTQRVFAIPALTYAPNLQNRKKCLHTGGTSGLVSQCQKVTKAWSCHHLGLQSTPAIGSS